MLFDANSDAAAGASSSVSRGHARGPPVRLMSIGGSMIAGGIPGGCPGSFSGHNRYDDSCTYPRLFAAKLAKKNGVSFENGAQGGTSTLSALPLLDTILREGTDLLLVDYSVNDALAIDTSGTAKPRDYSRWSMQVGAATEALVRHMLARYPRTALLLVVPTVMRHLYSSKRLPSPGTIASRTLRSLNTFRGITGRQHANAPGDPAGSPIQTPAHMST